jgi:transposase InsO family protein
LGASANPEEDIQAAIDLFIEYPQIGAAKARHTLIDREQALISSAFLNQAKQQLSSATEGEYQRRAQDEKFLEAELLARRQNQEDYQHLKADHPNHIWAIDFVAIRFLCFSLCIAVVYDVYSQAYLAIVAGSGCDKELAKEAIQSAVAKNGGLSAQLLRRDNGKAFLTDSIQQLLANLFLQDAPIPPASPWFNGSLESCNSGLKTTIKTHAMQELLLAPQVLKDARQSAQNAIAKLQNLCDTTLKTLNDKISRVKFGMPPAAAHNNQKHQVELRHQAFCEAKRSDRIERMKAIQAAPRRSRLTTYADKVTAVIRRKLKQLSTDQLFILNEIIHGRFAAIET